MSGAIDLARKVRKAGEGVGFTYDEPKEIQMQGPTPVMDCLTPADTSGLLELPHLEDPAKDIKGLDNVTKSLIQATHEVNVRAVANRQEKMAKRSEVF